MSTNRTIQEELAELNSQLPPAQQPLSVPEGYFEGLAAAVLARVRAEEEALDETDLANRIAGWPRTLPFAVPEGYFEQNLESLPFLVGDEASSLLAGISKEMPFALPEGYFQNVLAGLPLTTADEPVLEGLPKQMPLEVPAGYFEGLAERVAARTAAPAKVVPMVRRRWMRLAVAAALTGVMALGGYFWANRTSSEDALARELRSVPTTELDAFLQATAVNNATANNKRSVDVSELLDDVSDKELDAFLNQVPVADDDFNAIN